MYITVTFNPSIDYIVFVNDFRAGKLNRAKAEHAVPGGKGLNVSMVLRNLGKQTKAFAFTGGILGDALTEMVKKEGIDFVSIPASSGETRINVKLKSGEETEINGRGPSIGKEELERLTSILKDELREGDTLILSGSVPSTLPRTVYRDLAAMAREKGARAVVDAEGELLTSALSSNPFLIKPNRDELEAISGISPMTAEDIKEYAKKLRAMGAE
ncbi:MAG: hexose kinase, partial [Bullifex sp.]|nr:hexose kinase [Spirochaetales bacterium]MDY5778214.1 hexose kinase [Bullifex sp.]